MVQQKSDVDRCILRLSLPAKWVLSLGHVWQGPAQVTRDKAQLRSRVTRPRSGHAWQGPAQVTCSKAQLRYKHVYEESILYFQLHLNLLIGISWRLLICVILFECAYLVVIAQFECLLTNNVTAVAVGNINMLCICYN